MKKFILLFISTILVFGLILFLTIIGIYSYVYKDKVFPGVYITGQHVGNWSKDEVLRYFEEKNIQTGETQFIFSFNNEKWATNGAYFNYKFDEKKASDMAYNFGRSGKFFSDFSNKWSAFWNGISIENSVYIDENKIVDYLKNISLKTDIAPVEGLFEFQNGRVIAFKVSSEGRGLDISEVVNSLKKQISYIPEKIEISLPVKTIKPKFSTERANNFGIKELIGTGESYFKDSISSRVYNINLGGSKFHGVIISPNEIFSFNKTIGTVSTLTGYKQAYVIEKGKTVLGDGGGVCQVSSTLFRAALNAALPIIERVAHSYRVSYYEPPVGFDATVYDPSPDFKFKNDTGKHILVQTIIDNDLKKITFELYGTSDGRETKISDPVIISQTPAPPTTYQDDPTLPKGVEKQVDTAHAGANVYFTRKVIRGGQTLIDETIRSNYIPWAAVIMRGIKE